MKTALIRNGKIVNVIRTVPGWTLPEGLADAAMPFEQALSEGFPFENQGEPVPTDVSMAQFHRALRRAGIDPATITTLINGDADAMDVWEYSTSVRRDHPMVISFGGLLNQTAEQIDAIFRDAARLD